MASQTFTRPAADPRNPISQVILGSATGTPHDSRTWPGPAHISGTPSPGTRRAGTETQALTAYNYRHG